MKRKALTFLSDWSKQLQRKPLIIRGARQVGKSTLVRIFAAEENLKLIEINFEKQKISSLNNSSNFSVDKVKEEIELLTRQKFDADTLLFLDEIQEQPIALNRLRYFFEEAPEIRVIAAGSLLEAVMEKEQFSMPVGRVDYLFLGPLSFFEFLEAKQEDILLEQMQKISLENLPSETLHRRASDLLREFYFVGGMPACVNEFITTKDFEKVRDIQTTLIQSFKDDIPKYTKNQQGVLALDMFEKSPAMVGEAKLVFSKFSSKHSDAVKDAINLLAKAGIIYKVIKSNCAGLPLQAGVDPSIMKIFLLDVGIYNAMLGVQWRELFQLNTESLMIKGFMAEQFIAQQLMFRGRSREQPKLYYWLRDGKKGAAEVDFVIAENGAIYPVEVKSGTTGTMRSLWQYVAEKKCPLAIRLNLTLQEQFLLPVQHGVKTTHGVEKISCQLLGLPLYLAEEISRFIAKYSRVQS